MIKHNVQEKDRFGRLTVSEPNWHVPRSTSGKIDRAAMCVCDCGAEKVVRISDLTRGMTLSCGCLKSGDARLSLALWMKMRIDLGETREQVASSFGVSETYMNRLIWKNT
jgi:hypothetical protein